MRIQRIVQLLFNTIPYSAGGSFISYEKMATPNQYYFSMHENMFISLQTTTKRRNEAARM